MTRDHKLIVGGAFAGIAGSLFAMATWPLALALLVGGLLLIAGAGRA
jgi:hypothetical protein